MPRAQITTPEALPDERSADAADGVAVALTHILRT